jgi:hypothetical protein
LKSAFSPFPIGLWGVYKINYITHFGQFYGIMVLG